jgi:hippurate hydrolase
VDHRTARRDRTKSIEDDLKLLQIAIDNLGDLPGIVHHPSLPTSGMRAPCSEGSLTAFDEGDTMTSLIADIGADLATIRAWRHRIHARPELAFEERVTSGFVAEKLKSWGWDVIEGIGRTGVVASLTVGGSPRSVGLRAELDALPVFEASEADHRSTVPGCSHTCGHDGHTTMLLAAARHLARTRAFEGTVRCIFQPAEETMGGALAMIDDGLFERFPVDSIFSLHNMPGLERGDLYFRTGPVLSAVDTWEIVLTGKGGHGSMPERCVDPVVAGASLVMALQTIVSRNVGWKDAAVVTIGAFLAGEAANVVPEEAILRLSIRTATPEIRDLVLGRVRAITAAQASSFGVEYEIREGTAGAVVVNDAATTATCAAVAAGLLGEDRVHVDGPAFMASDDFAFFLAPDRPGAYAFIGNGDTPMVHHPKYDFDDRILPIGAAYWVALAERILAPSGS